MSGLLIIGLDGGTGAWIERWAAQGRLPNIARILREGVSAQLTGAELVVEHGSWVSLLSGISRAESGYYYFRQLVPGSYRLQTVTAADFDAPPFWSYLRGKQALIVDPPEGRMIGGLDGLQVLNWDTYTPQDPSGYPFTVSDVRIGADLLRQFGPPLRSPDRHGATPAENRVILRRLLAAVRRKGDLTCWLLDKATYDVAFITFPETHSAGHQLFDAAGDLQDAARQVYAAVDAEIGRIRAVLPPDTGIALIAPVGMRDSYPNGGLVELLLRKLGYQADPLPNDTPAGLLPLLRHFIPEPVRAALSRRLHTRAQREAIVAAQFTAATNWARTRAFALPSSYTGLLRVNLRGREPQGIVAPGAEYYALLDALEADLRVLVDASSGAPAVERIQRAVDLFPGAPPENLPDLFVDWNPARFMDSVIHPHARLQQARPEFFRRSDHAEPGFFAVCGASVLPLGRLPDASPLVIAPTLLALAQPGTPLPERLGAAPLGIYRQ